MKELSNEQLTAIYAEANGLRPNQLAPITTERVFKAMRAMQPQAIAATEPKPEEPRKLSDRLVALMRHSKTLDPDLSWESVAKALGELYHPTMSIFDSIYHLLAAYEEILEEPRFEAGRAEGTTFSLLFAPIKGYSSIDIMGPKSMDEKYTVHQFYSSIADYLWARIRLTRVDWCRDQLYPSEVK